MKLGKAFSADWMHASRDDEYTAAKADEQHISRGDFSFSDPAMRGAMQGYTVTGFQLDKLALDVRLLATRLNSPLAGLVVLLTPLALALVFRKRIVG